MNIDKVGNKKRKDTPKGGHTSFQRKCGRFSKSPKYWNKENQHRNHSRFQILRKSVCYKIISAPTAHRVLVLKDQNEVERKSSLGSSTCRLCFGHCLCVKMKDKEYESFIFNSLQHLQTENCHVHYMKKCSRTPLDLVRSSCSPDSLVGKMESDNKIPKDPRMNSSGQVQNSLQKTNLSSNLRFTSKLIGLVDSLGKTSTENTCSRSYKILNKDINSNSSHSPVMEKNSACRSSEPLLVDTELERKVGSNKKLLPKLKGDLIDPNNLKAIESACKDTWYTYMPNAQISSKKRKEEIFSDCINSKKALCEELNFFSTKRGSVVCRQYIANPHKVPINIQSQEDCQILESSGLKTSKTNLAVNSTTQCKIKNISEKNGSKLFLDKLDNLFVKISKHRLQNMYPSNCETSQATSRQLMDPRQDVKRILKRKAEPREVLLKRVKWCMNIAASSNCLPNNMKRLENINVVKPGLTPVHKNTNIQNDISNLQVPPIRKELVDPRLKRSKIFPSNPSLCDKKQYSSEKEKAGITGFALKQNEAPSSSKLSVKSRVQVSSELPTKHPYSNSVTHFTSVPSQVSCSKMSFKTSVCASSVTSTKCTYSHPTLPKTKQGVPDLQMKCTGSHSPTDFTSHSIPASPSALSVKTSVCLPSEMQANCTNEHLTSSSDTSVKASLHVSSENQAKRTHDSSTLLKTDEHDVVPKKRAKYSSHHNPLSLSKCDINISSVQTASGSAISVKILEYSNSTTGNEINVEVLSQHMQVGKTASTVTKNISGTNELRAKKFIRNQSSCDISKETLLSPSATLTSTVQSSDNPLSSNMKKSTTTFSTGKVFNKQKVPRLDKPTSSLKRRKESSNKLHSKQACSEVTSNRKSMLKSLCQEVHVVPNKKCHRTNVSNEKLSLPNPKQQGHSKNQSLLKKCEQKSYKRNIKSLVSTLKKHFNAQCQTISSCVSLNNTASNTILPFDFKVEDFMEEVSCAPIEPQFKNFKLSTIWRKTLCTPLKFAGRLSWECYLNYACSDSITKPATAMELFEQFLQNGLSMHLIKHSNVGLVGIMKYFAVRALKLYKSKIRRKQSNTKKCPNPPTSSTNPILTLETCLDTSEGLPENSLETDNKHACCKIESVGGNKVEMVDSKKFSVSTMWIKKDLEWEMFFQCSNLMVCFNFEHFKKDSISLLLSKKGISFYTLDCFNFLMKSEDKIQKPNACMFQEQFLCNVYTKNEKFLSSAILGTPEGMFLNTYCQELQYSDFVKEKRLKRSNNVSIYKFLCNNYKTMNVFKSMSLNTLCLKSNRLLSQDESLDAVSEKYLTFFKLENEQIYFVKQEMLPSKLSVTYKMSDDICIKKDPKCSIFKEITSCKQESNSKGFSQTFGSSCAMEKEIFSENVILPTTDAYKSEPGVFYKNNCLVNMKMETTKFSKSLKFQIKDNSKNKVIIDPSWMFNDTDILPQPQEELAHGTTTLISTSLQLPASKVNGSVITALSATSVQLPPSQEQSYNDFSTSALEDTDLQLPASEEKFTNCFSTTALDDTNIQVPQSKEQLSNEFSTTALSVTNIQVPQSKEPLSNGFSTTVSSAANIQLPALQEQSSSGFCSTSTKATNIQMHTSEVQSCNSAHTTASNPTSVQLPVLEEQTAKDGEGRNESTCKDMNNLNDIGLTKASLADTNIKSQALSQDFYSLLDSLSNLLEKNNYTDSIDSDKSLRNGTESEMLSQDESDSSLLDSILDYYESSIAKSSENSQSVQTVSKSSNKSLLSLLQEISMPSRAQINSGTELCSSHVSLLASSKTESAPNLAKQKTCSPQVFGQLSLPSSKDNFKLNISQKKIRSPHYSPKTSETLLLSTSQETSMPVIAQRNIESLHFSDLASSKEAIASNIRKRKSSDCSPEVATKLFASSKKPFMPNIAPKETAAKASSLKVLKKYFKQSQNSACCSSVLSLNPTSEPRNTSLSPTCETETSLNCDKNSCTGAVASSEVFQTDCHLKGKKLNVCCEILNSAFHDFDLFEEGKPLRRYYQHLVGTGNHVLNLDCICKGKTELSGEMLESYNFLKDQLDYHRCLLRGLIHTASNPDADCDVQMDRRIANELEYIDGYELACQALLL